MANAYWIGRAKAVAQVTTITFSAYTSGTTYTLTVNGKSVTFTATTSVEQDILTGLQAAWTNATEAEFSEATALGTAGTGLVLTGVTAGQTFTVTASVTSGTPTVTATTAATGPNHWSNAENWQGGSSPSASDDIILRDSAVSILYGLVDATNYTSVTVEASYTGEIGLPATNAAGYPEYRQRELKLGNGASAIALTIGLGEGNFSPFINYDCNGAECNATIYGSGNSTSSERPVTIRNTGASSDIAVHGGQCYFTAASSGTIATLRVLPYDNANVDVWVDSVTSAGVITASGGILTVEGASTSIEASENAVVTFLGTATCPTVNVSSGAQVNWNSSAGITTRLRSYPGGTVSFAGHGSAKTVAAANLYSGGSILDPLGIITWTADIVLEGCKIEDVNLDLGRGRTVGVS